MRRSRPVRIGELWSGFVRENPAVSRHLTEARVPEVWARVNGPAIASLTRSVDVCSGVLNVCMTSSVARHEIFMRREEIRQKLNTELGSPIIKNIIVK